MGPMAVSTPRRALLGQVFSPLLGEAGCVDGGLRAALHPQLREETRDVVLLGPVFNSHVAMSIRRSGMSIVRFGRMRPGYTDDEVGD